MVKIYSIECSKTYQNDIKNKLVFKCNNLIVYKA